MSTNKATDGGAQPRKGPNPEHSPLLCLLYQTNSTVCYTMPAVNRTIIIPFTGRRNLLRKPTLQFIDWSSGGVGFCTFYQNLESHSLDIGVECYPNIYIYQPIFSAIIGQTLTFSINFSSLMPLCNNQPSHTKS